MVEALTIASLALLLAGTGAQVYGQRQQRNAQQDALTSHQQRLDEIAKRGQENFAEQLKLSDADRATQDIDANALQFENDVADLVARPNFPTALSAGQADAPRVVQDTNARELANELGKARARIAAQAQLQGFQSQRNNRSFELDRGFENLSFLGGDARGSANIRQAGLFDADSAGFAARTIGGLAQGAGTIGVGVAAQNAAAEANAALTAQERARQAQQSAIQFRNVGP